MHGFMQRILALALSALMLLTVSTATRAQSNGLTAEQAKTKIARAGTGEKAKVTVWTRENDFTERDRKTDAESVIAYSDVNKIDLNRGHSTARNIGIGVGAGVGGLLLIIAITLAHLD